MATPYVLLLSFPGINVVSAADFAGEMGVLSNKRRNATIIATSPMTVIVMSGHEFRAIERTLPGVGARVRAVAEERELVLV